MTRGTGEAAGSLFGSVDPEERVPARPPLRLIRRIVNDALASLDAEFDALYTDSGCPSIAPARLIRASLLQILDHDDLPQSNHPKPSNTQNADWGTVYGDCQY